MECGKGKSCLALVLERSPFLPVTPLPPVPQLCPLWSLPFALFPGDAGRFGKLGAFPELGVRDSGLVYTHRESKLLFPRSHGSIICFYVASPGLWPPVLVMLRCQAHYFSSEQSKTPFPRHADSNPPGRGRRRVFNASIQSRARPRGACAQRSLPLSARPELASGERVGSARALLCPPPGHRGASPAPGAPRAGVQKPHSDPEALALSASTEGAGGAGSRAGSRWALLCSPLSYVHSTD